MQLLDKIIGMPVVGPHGPCSATGAVLGRSYCHFDRCRGPDSVNCLEVPQFAADSPQFSAVAAHLQGRRHPCLYAVADPHGSVQKTVESTQFVDMVADFPVVRSYRSPQVVHTPVVCNDRCYVSQLQLVNKVVYTPEVAQS